ncbi:GGDEF domain-containing protein [Mesoterricola sediminis]|uniref:diguanylate cyclase n=1 Tax=Mesoterricola sediminis TaxID=2927980 RepID=A0AA48KFI0_9BACT|nr:GGDEF domain-containing protein [Mesoterricola sediminis]BDU76478.1 hypothetical protein METESE_14360 [Mesoterricola sediminis]
MFTPLRDLAALARPDPAGQDLKLEVHREFSAAMSVVCGLTAAGLWLWDWTIDPASAPRTAAFRGGILALYLANALVLVLGRRRRPLVAFGVAQALAGEALFVLLLDRLRGGMGQAPGGFMYFFMVPLVLFQGFPLAAGLLYAVLAALLPHAMALAGAAPGFPHGAYAVLIWPAFLVTSVAQAAFALGWQRRQETERDLERAGNTDSLTGVGNRRHFARVLAREMGRSRRFRHPLSLLLLDIDHFKRVNDTCGHLAGDRVIRRVAEACREGSRESDSVARWGGEEFAVLLPESDADGAWARAERIREAVEALAVDVGPGPPVRCTVSVGVAAMRDGEDGDAFVRRADEALYRAKAAGRNQVGRAPD